MNLTYLKSFLAAADTLSFTKAAKSLFTTQSSLSRHISALEEELGVKLMERDRHHVMLTEAGQTLFAEEKQLISYINTIERHVKDAESREHAKLDVICSPMYSQCLRNIYKEYTRLHPHVALNIFQTEWGGETKVVIRNEADLCIVYPTSDDIEDSTLTNRILKREPLCFACSIDSPLTHKTELCLEDFSEETLLYAEQPVSQIIQDIHYSVRKYFKNFKTVNNLHAVLLGVSNNTGIGIWPESVARDTQSFSYVLKVRDFHEHRDLSATWLTENTNPEIENFLSLCCRLL
ncbi:MAG: LysR family transcriptional regulator [Clostridiales bacterium]|nr:LysR family transcriptional regulator [Clostridiales bacterium]